MNAQLGKITRQNGIAGQFALTVDVTYPDEPTSAVTFIGSVYGGPVIMQTPGYPAGVVVTDPGRFGTFGPEWVRRFFGGEA